MPEAPPLSLDDFARLTARLQSGLSRARVLDEAGIEESEWLRSQRIWLERMATLAQAGDHTLHGRYLDRLAELSAEEAKQAEPRPLSGDMPAPPAERIAPRPSQLARARRAPGRAPLAAAAPLPPPTRGGPPPMRAKPRTMEIGAFAEGRSAALPFRPAAEEQEPAPSSTLDGAPLPAGAALPFAPSRASPVKRAAPDDGALPFRSEARPAADDPLARTMSGDEESPARAAALPFRGGDAPAPRTSAPRLDLGLPFRVRAAAEVAISEKPQPPHKRLASTMAVVPEEDLDRTVRREAPSDPRLTLEQLASLTAEIAANPDEARAIERRYGLDPKSHDREKGAWARRFLENPALGAEYAARVREYRAWLAKKR